MSEQVDVIQRYIECFDDCRPIIYKGIYLEPFLVKDIRLCNYACYCLMIDPLEYDDITLMPLRRLGLILTISNRILSDELPSSLELQEKYFFTIQSFKALLRFIFKGCTWDFIDPQNSKRKNIIRIINSDGYSQIFNEKEFEELSDLILYHNGMDVSYKRIPAAMRKDANRVRELLNKKNKSKAPSIEKMIDCAFLTLKDYNKVLNLPVRKFYNLINNTQKREEYSILMSGSYVVEGIEHWMNGDYTKNAYEGVFEKEVETKKKLNNYRNL